MKQIKNFIKDFIRGIKNFWYFRKEIYNYRSWDYSFTENILLKSLEAQYDSLLNQEYVALDESKNVLKSLRIAIMILKRRNEDFYSEMWYSKYSKYVTIEDKKIIYHKHKNITTISDMEKRDWKIFTNIMNKYFETWWW